MDLVIERVLLEFIWLIIIRDFVMYLKEVYFIFLVL